MNTGKGISHGQWIGVRASIIAFITLFLSLSALRSYGQIPMPTPPPGGSGSGGSGQSGQTPGCYNSSDPKPCPPNTCCLTKQGVNPVDAASGDVQRNIQDLQVFGGVGEHQLNWTRYGHSRYYGGFRWFGDGHVWRHSYQWEMTSPSAGNLTIIYPNGEAEGYWFHRNVWNNSTASNPDQLTQSGSNYYLRRADGFTYHFATLSGSGGAVYYQMQDFTDSFSNHYTLTYDSSNRVTKITEPAGRWLQVTYQDIVVNKNQFTTLYANSGAPAAGWNSVTVSNTNAFRYLRYYSTDPGGVQSYCNIAEMEFYDIHGNKLSGTPFGSSPSYQNSANTFDKASDGNVNTYFDYSNPNYGFTGIDLGAGNAAVIGSIRFYPRAGFEARMNGGNGEGYPTGCRFEGSNVAPITESVITQVQAGYGSGAGEVVTSSVSYSYSNMNDPVLAGGWLVLNEADYSDGSKGRYTYQSVFAGQQPLIYAADDSRYIGNAPRIIYEFWGTNNWVFGSIYAEHDFATNQLLAKFEGENGSKYNNMGRKVTYANGGARHLAMANDNNVNSFTNELGYTTNYVYGTNNGFLSSETDPLGRTTSYTRDSQGRVLSITYPDSTTESWTRDALGHPLTHTDPRGNVTTYTRDANGRVTNIAYPDGGSEGFTYNSFGEVLTHRQRNGGTESFTYDARGLVQTKTDALSHITTYTSGTNDLVATITDPLSHTTGFTYNERGQVTQVTNPDSTISSATYDAYGDKTSVTNENGKNWLYGFDEFKRRITSTDPLGNITQYFYDEPGASCGSCGGGGAGLHLTTLILPSGKTTKFGYDLAWRRISKSEGYGTADIATTQYAYDAADNLIATTDPVGKVWTSAYDSLDRQISATDPLGNVTQWTYDASGNKLTETRPDSGVTAYTYDSLNRLLTTTDPKSQVTSFGYDTTGNVVRRTDPRGYNYTFTYDLLNRKKKLTYPDATAEQWSYDAAGNLATYTTRASQVQTFTFDNRNRQTATSWSDSTPAVTASYDSASRLLTLSSSVSALAYTYDDANRLLSESQSIAIDGTSRLVSYSYDADGNRSSLTYPSGSLVSYTYTGRNQIASISADGPPPIATFAYDANGRRTAKNLENGTSAAYSFDNDGRLVTLDNRVSASSFARLDYAYNSVGDRTSRVETTGAGAATDTYQYDAIDQVTGVTYGSGRVVSYAFDSSGNRTSVTDAGATASYTPNNLNQYTAVSGTGASYDANGNLTAFNSWTYGYDAQNRLITVNGGPAGVSATFAYDARNRCVSRVINSATTCYTFDGWNLLADYAPGGAELRRYIHGPQVDEMLAILSGSSLWYYHQDALGNTVRLTDTNGAVAESYTYDIYGAPTIKDATGATLSASAVGNRFLYTGREWLADTATYDYRNRAYLPTWGRFAQVDPIRAALLASRDPLASGAPWLGLNPSRLKPHMGIGELFLGPNLYAYVTDDPLNAIDPFGLQEIIIEAPPVVEPGVVPEPVAPPVVPEPAPPMPAPVPVVPPGGPGGSGGGTGNKCKKDPDPDCKKEWDDAYSDCEKELAKPNPSKAITGGYSDVYNCARGLVSEACGGNAVSH